MANSRRGLKELYGEFGRGQFTGDRLRTVMVNVIGGPSAPKSGWQAALALSRLVRSGHVDEVFHDEAARASWGHSYQISSRGLTWLGVDVIDEDEELRRFLQRVGTRRVRISPSFINDPSNRAILRLAVAGRWLEMVVSVTPLGEEFAGGDKLHG